MMKLLGLPILSSQHGEDVDKLIFYLHVLMIALFVGWSAYFFYAIWRFRASRNPKADYVGVTNHASSYIEVAVAIAEGILLFALAVPLWAKSASAFPDPAQSTVLRIIGQQFNWTARYPGPDGVFGKSSLELVAGDNPLGLDKNDPAGKDDIVATGSEIAVPKGKPVIANISSLDVIHSFKVTPLRVTQDANPGMSIPIHFVPTRTGTNFIQCSQLCGTGHYSMFGRFIVFEQPQFEAWLKTKSGGAAGYE
jgi:cytochrome c oxidase subunit 2